VAVTVHSLPTKTGNMPRAAGPAGTPFQGLFGQRNLTYMPLHAFCIWLNSILHADCGGATNAAGAAAIPVAVPVADGVLADAILASESLP
jgi:hypothetical protein